MEWMIVKRGLKEEEMRMGRMYKEFSSVDGSKEIVAMTVLRI